MSDNVQAAETVSPIQHVGRTLIVKATGERALILGPASTTQPGWVQASADFSPYSSRGYKIEDVELAPKRDMTSRKGYDLKEDLGPYIHGMWTLPNFEPYKGEPLVWLNNIAGSGGRGSGYAKLPDGHKGWATFFLGSTQGGSLDGTGYVIVYRSPRWLRETIETGLGQMVLQWQTGGAAIGHFAICKHKKVDGASANHIRGWHPGHCEKCGMDMTVDSGD